MGAAAELDAVGAGFEHPDPLAVLVAEECNRSLVGRVGHRHLDVMGVRVGQHLGGDQILDLGDLFGGHRLVVAEVEAEPIGTDPRTLLLDVVAEHGAKGVVQQVGAGVVAHDRPTTFTVDAGRHRVALVEHRRRVLDMVQVKAGHGVGAVGHGHLAARTGEHSGVADLAAGFRVERCAVEHDPAVGDGKHASLGLVNLAADEVGVAVQGVQRHEVAHVGTAAALGLVIGTPSFTLSRHLGLEFVGVDRDTAFSRDLGGHLEWEPVGVMERERRRTGQFLAGVQFVDRRVQHDRALLERLAKALLFAFDDTANEVVGVLDLGIVRTHDVDDLVDHGRSDEIAGPQQVGVADRAPHDASQHVATFLVAREDPVADQEGHGPAVLGEDANRHVTFFVAAVDVPRQLAGLVDEALHLVDLEHRIDPLGKREDPLEAGAGVDRGRRQVDPGPVLEGLVLHEDQVPELEEPFFAAELGAAVVAEGRALVDEELAARTVGTGVGHLPVIVLVETLDALGAHPDGVAPDLLGLVVGQVHGDPQLLGVQSEHLGREFPGERDRLLLEVVAEAEVAHHLEEGEMALGPADFVQVVVLAAGPGTLLNGHGPLVGRCLLTDEVRLERHHSRNGEHDRGVVRYQARALDCGVAPLDEVVTKCLAQLASFHSPPKCTCPSIVRRLHFDRRDRRAGTLFPGGLPNRILEPAHGAAQRRGPQQRRGGVRRPRRRRVGAPRSMVVG